MTEIEKLKQRIKELEEELEEYNSSFDLYWKATRALQKLYPHPNPLVWRDIGEMCRMAVEEIEKSRGEKNE